MSSHRACPFSAVFDVVIFGAGYAGFAAALASRRAERRVLLVDRHAALLPESGWSFTTDRGTSTDPLWLEWRQRLECHRQGTTGDLDGAIAEVLATDWLHMETLPVLYHAAPVAPEWSENGLLNAIVLATKGGLRRVAGRRWIDATDEGQLAALLDETWRVPIPQRQTLNLFFRHPRPGPLPSMELPAPVELPAQAKLRWHPSEWPGEQILSIDLPGEFASTRQAWLPALRALRETAADQLTGAVLTHGSVVPWKRFARADCPFTALLNQTNVGFVGACGRTLAEKFEGGVVAARRLENLACADPRIQDLHTPFPTLSAPSSRSTDIAVAGLGTGGAMAAIAAARQGARVCAFDAMPFPGGVGTGGGIHVYYFGVKGGLQEELDQRVRELMPLFGSPAQVGGFHPEAKKRVLDAMLAEAGVETCYTAQLAAVVCDGRTIDSALLTTATGRVSVQAHTWVDATGDADLATAAGARYRLGRQGDGLLHAYGQSSGRAVVSDGVARLQIINFDAGFCDPTDPLDLTRARVSSVRNYVQPVYGVESRPTYIAPALGVRQSRHVETDYTLSLDDLINRRRFADAVGYTGCHYDNHARDYEFETGDAAFWVWVCQQWYGRLACEIPLRSLLPLDLDNVVLACRALGVSEEAHHSVRMQRDMQRIGEVAGVAAALAHRNRCGIRGIDLPALRQQLATTGAVKIASADDTSFGNAAGPDYFDLAPGQISRWITELQGGPATEALWHLYRCGPAAKPQVRPLLDSAEATTSWRAAAILAMWGDADAEPRLLHAIRIREDDQKRDITRPQQEWFYVPRWYAALTLLKRCVTHRSLPLLQELAADPSLVLNLRNAVALALEAWAHRHAGSPADHARAQTMLDALLATQAPQSLRDPQDAPLGADTPPSMPRAADLRPVMENYSWQLHLAVARARRALKLPLQESARLFQYDERAIVRRAFATFS